jgi:hypothetical protein
VWCGVCGTPSVRPSRRSPSTLANRFPTAQPFHTLSRPATAPVRGEQTFHAVLAQLQAGRREAVTEEDSASASASARSACCSAPSPPS